MEPVSEGMDTTINSSIIQKYVPGTLDAATQVPVIKKRSVLVSRDQSILLFSLLFFFPAILFFLPIMLKNLLLC